MRNYLELDDALLAEAARLTGLRTKREVIEEALRVLIDVRRQEDQPGGHGGASRIGSLKDQRSDESKKK